MSKFVHPFLMLLKALTGFRVYAVRYAYTVELRTYERMEAIVTREDFDELRPSLLAYRDPDNALRSCLGTLK